MTSLGAVARRARLVRAGLVATLVRCARAYLGDREGFALPRHHPG